MRAALCSMLKWASVAFNLGAALIRRRASGTVVLAQLWRRRLMTKSGNRVLRSAHDHAPIHVCSLEAMPRLVVQTQARHLITVINQMSIPPTPGSLLPESHLRLAMNDITTPQDGLVHPNQTHIEALLSFAQAWNRQGPLVVHCWAGISRSTAAAFITQCALNEPGHERDFALALRAASPTATPNALMVELADDLLGRNGRMIDAIEEIGSGEMAMAASAFVLASGR
jgi:predicted protein tyrosine phosphatase